MAHGGRDTDLRISGLRLRARFTLLMSAALALVMAVAGFFLWKSSTTLARNVQEDTLCAAARLTAQATDVDAAVAQTQTELAALRWVERSLAAANTRDPVTGVPDPEAEKLRGALATELRDRIALLERTRDEQKPYWSQVGSNAVPLDDGRVLRTDVAYGENASPGTLYRVQRSDQRPFSLLIPAVGSVSDEALLGLIIGTVILVILVGAGVSVFVAGQVAGPLEQIVEDIRHISTGDLNHRTRAHGAGELQLLARSIDRMTKNLAEAQENELALSIREGELAVATEVREALLPQTTPELSGFEVGATHISSDELWGDFHDFLEVSDPQHGRRVGLLVCDVSGKGLPGALVGATARSYLRSVLSRGVDVKEALQEVNRELARDVKRGMYVSALYVLVDPTTHIALVACAGHKMPLVRYTASDGKVRLIQPEGIALAFDKGPIFDSRLEVAHVPIEPGDRLVLVNTGAVEIASAEGRELGEKPLYAQIMKHGAEPTPDFLERMRSALEGYAAGSELPRDISIVTVARPA